MHHPRMVLGLTLLMTFVAGCGGGNPPEQTVSPTASENEPVNPFLVESDLPYGMPRFDLIRDEHYVPAFERGMAEEMSEILAIASNAEPPSHENTIVALELTGQLLNRTQRVFGAMTSAHTNDNLKEIQSMMAPKFAEHADNINLNAELFSRVESLYQQREALNLDPESLRLLDRYYIDFVRAGARLDDEGKARLREINTENAELSATFSQNLINEVNDAAVVVDTREELDGLSDTVIDSAAEEAANRGLDGKYVITLRNTTQQPALFSLKNRELRRRIQEVSASRGSRGNEYDNREVISRVLELRAERAALLGYDNHASYILEDRTAGTVGAVNDMLGRLGPRAVANARREAVELQSLINEMETEPFELAAWDWLYYSEILRQQRYDFDADQLKPYFEIDKVLQDGVFFFAEKLYGITFEERPELPVYQEDVRVFEAFFDGEPLGLFLFDPYARESKRGGAWMNAYVPQSRLMNTSPVVGNHLNIVKPPEGEVTLLTMDEANTMFHEFGHALHGLFSNVTYPRFSGTRVPRDFVEFPSQVHEMWATWPEVLANYAVHYQTGEAIPRNWLTVCLLPRNLTRALSKRNPLQHRLSTRAGISLMPHRSRPPSHCGNTKTKSWSNPACNLIWFHRATEHPISTTSWAAILRAITPTPGAKYSTPIRSSGLTRTAV